MKKIKIILLFCLILFHLAYNFMLISNDSCNILVRGKDWQAHIRNFSVLLNRLELGKNYHAYDKAHSKIYNLVMIAPDYPPFFYWVAAGIKFLFGNFYPPFVLLSSSFFLIILIILTYRLAEYWQSGAGLLAAFFCSFYPFIFMPSRFFNLELAVCAMVSLSIYLFLKTEMFKKRWPTIFLGISLGLGMLTKYTFFIFLIGPLALAIIKLIKGPKAVPGWPERVKNILLCFAIAILLSGLYYFSPRVLSLLVIRAMNLDYGIPDKTIIGRFIFYIQGLVTKGLGRMVFLGILIPFWFFLKIKRQEKGILYLWIFLPIIFVSILPKHFPELEYIIPSLPALAVVSSVGIWSIKVKAIRVLTVIFLCFVLFFQFLHPQPPERAFCFDKESHYIYQIFKTLGSQKCYIAQIIDNRARKDFLGIEPFFDIWSKAQARVEDFFVCPPAFVRNLDKYEFLINATYKNDVGWPESGYLSKELITYCRNNKIALIWDGQKEASFEEGCLSISKNDLEKIDDFKNQFMPLGTIIFCPTSLEGPFVRINIYKKINSRINFTCREMSSKLWQNDFTLYKFLDMLRICKNTKNYKDRLIFLDKNLKGNLKQNYIAIADNVIFPELMDISRASKNDKQYEESIKVLLKGLALKEDRTLGQKGFFKIMRKNIPAGNSLIFSELIDISRICKHNGEYPVSLTALTKALFFNANKEQIFVELDDLFIKWANSSQGLQLYLGLKEIYPEDENICLRLGRLYKLVQDYELSRKYFCKVIEYNPTCQEALQGIVNADFFIAYSLPKNSAYR